MAAVFENDRGVERLTVDTPPEFRLQLIDNGIPAVSAVLYTHDHADHVHGIDDLRAVSVRTGKLPLYGPEEVLERVRTRFSYIFDDGVVPLPGTSKPILSTHPLEPGVPVSIAGMQVVPLECDHGDMRVFGYRVGDFGYLTDVKTVSNASLELLEGVRVLVINALFEEPHPTHLSIPESVALAQKIAAEKTFLTHLTHRFRHTELEDRLPEGIAPAFDGLTVTL